jgi:hypothetical protein
LALNSNQKTLSFGNVSDLKAAARHSSCFLFWGDLMRSEASWLFIFGRLLRSYFGYHVKDLFSWWKSDRK